MHGQHHNVLSAHQASGFFFFAQSSATAAAAEQSNTLKNTVKQQHIQLMKTSYIYIFDICGRPRSPNQFEVTHRLQLRDRI